MITYIDVNEISPHPNNPRRDLGDLTELAASIKINGVLQNLTVIPRESGGWTVVIGHRRLAAAKLAGLTEAPCIIAQMDEKEQVSTMLLENMQRSDLTVIEQAQGFQLMLDLGETTQTISEKTGFSETTVRKRLFVASLDANYDGLYSTPRYYKGVFMGVNLYFKNRFLGTFDSTKEAAGEMNRILRCKAPVCCVRGKSDWEQWEMIKTTNNERW